MRKILTITIFGLIICSCSSQKQDYSYFDLNNQEISKSEFRKKRSTNKYLDIQIDSLKQKKLIERTKTGKLENLKILQSLLSNKSNEKIDFNKTLTIIYYPGKDPCNSSGFQTSEHIKDWYGTLETGIEQLSSNKPIYVYKQKDGLDKYNEIINWHKDPEGIVERLFFENPYPCSSFVVISPQGNYIAYYGEFSKEYVWNAIKLAAE